MQSGLVFVFEYCPRVEIPHSGSHPKGVTEVGGCHSFQNNIVANFALQYCRVPSITLQITGRGGVSASFNSVKRTKLEKDL